MFSVVSIQSNLHQLPPRLVSLSTALIHLFRCCCVPVRTSCDVCVTFAKTVLVPTSILSYVLRPSVVREFTAPSHPLFLALELVS